MRVFKLKATAYGLYNNFSMPSISLKSKQYNTLWIALLLKCILLKNVSTTFYINCLWC